MSRIGFARRYDRSAEEVDHLARHDRDVRNLKEYLRRARFEINELQLVNKGQAAENRRLSYELDVISRLARAVLEGDEAARVRLEERLGPLPVRRGGAA